MILDCPNCGSGIFIAEMIDGEARISCSSCGMSIEVDEKDEDFDRIMFVEE